jgi:uncharacterized membrane protein
MTPEMTPLPTAPAPSVHRGKRALCSSNGWSLGARLLLGFAVATAVAVLLTGSDGLKVIILAEMPVMLVVVACRYGWRLLGLYLAVAFAVATLFENLSITTGFPFGHYHYTVNTLRIGHFPVLVGFLYCSLGLVCWLVASTLLDGADARLADRTDPSRRINIVALPVLAAGLMAVYDLGSDSVASTLGKVWVWENGGGVFGVPWTNYVGWWLVSYVFFQILAFILATRTRALPIPNSREPLVHGVILYFLLGVPSLFGFLNAPRDTVTDLGGLTWNVHALHETMFTFNLFSTFLIVALAATKLARNDLALRGQERA